MLPTPGEPGACLGFFPSSRGLRFDLLGFCATLTGSADYTYQNNLKISGGAGAARLSGTAQGSAARYINTIVGSASLDLQRATDLGILRAAATAQWSKASNDDTDDGDASVQELKASLAGATVGYTYSLMDFWSEDFLMTTVAAPSRSAGLVSYEHRIFDDATLAMAIESGLPSSRDYSEGIQSIDFSAPLLTARALYRNRDGWQAQLAALVRQAKFPANPSVRFLPQTATTRIGRAVTGGATVPTRFIAARDYFSGQATYASDASPFLGTQADLATLAATVPTTGPTTGWSEILSFHHQWSPQWESNLFESYLALDADLIGAKPTVRTWRYGMNLYWRPIDPLRLGIELDQVNTTLAANGVAGFLTGSGGKARVAYVDARWSF